MYIYDTKTVKGRKSKTYSLCRTSIPKGSKSITVTVNTQPEFHNYTLCMSCEGKEDLLLDPEI